MNRTSRRSTLQTQILASLDHSTADSVTALARELGAPRPSVSRSLHRLKADELVERVGRQWHITEAGGKEAARAVSNLQETTRDVVEIAGKKFRAASRISEMTVGEALQKSSLGSLGKMMSSIPDPTLGLPFNLAGELCALQQFPNISSMAERAMAIPNFQLSDAAATAIGSMSAFLNGEYNPTSKLLASVAGEALSGSIATQFASNLGINAVAKPLTPDIQSIVSPLLAAQQSYASLLGGVSARELPFSFEAIAAQSSLLSSTLSDAIQLPTALDLLPAELWTIPNWLGEMSQSLQGVFEAELVALQDIPAGEIGSLYPERLVYATAPVVHYAETSRHLLRRETEHSTAVVEEWTDDLGNEELDPLLARLNPVFVDKRKGSWIALNGTNPDRLAPAAGSQKNLLLQVLRLLVKDADLPDTEDAPGSKIKARIKQIMGGSKSEAEHVKCVADAVFSGYSIFNKYDHTNQKNALALRAHMQTAESLLFMVLIRLED